MSVTPFLMFVTPFPASVTCSWHVSRSSQCVCQHHPGVCHPVPSVSPLPDTHHIFPSICHPFPACYPIFSMSASFQGGSGCSQCVFPLEVLAGLWWDTPLLMESPRLGKATQGKNSLPPFHFHGPNCPCPSATKK